MKTDRELIQQALKMIRSLRYRSLTDVSDEIISALEERLAQPEPEPVAHVYFLDEPSGRPRVAWDNANGIKIGDKLYTTPPQRKPLMPISYERMTTREFECFMLGWRGAEAAHGIKGEA